MRGLIVELALNVLGQDRPGIGGEVLGALIEGGASIRAAHGGSMAGRFAFSVVVEADSEDALIEAVEEVAARLDLEVSVTPAEGFLMEREATEQAILSCYGPADPVVMARLFGVLGGFGINVEEFRFDQMEGAGQERLRGELRMRVPRAVDLDTIIEHLRKLEDEVGLESSLRWDPSFMI